MLKPITGSEGIFQQNVTDFEQTLEINKRLHPNGLQEFLSKFTCRWPFKSQICKTAHNIWTTHHQIKCLVRGTSTEGASAAQHPIVIVLITVLILIHFDTLKDSDIVNLKHFEFFRSVWNIFRNIFSFFSYTFCTIITISFTKQHCETNPIKYCFWSMGWFVNNTQSIWWWSQKQELRANLSNHVTDH